MDGVALLTGGRTRNFQSLWSADGRAEAPSREVLNMFSEARRAEAQVAAAEEESPLGVATQSL